MTITKKESDWLRAVEGMAEIFSTCSRRKYAAVILSPNGRIIGMGYNGSAPNSVHCEDGGCPRANTDVPHGSTYDNCIAIHAEANAIIWSDQAMRVGATLIVNGPPCYSCAKLIASSGIAKVVCKSDDAYAQFDDIMNYLNGLGIELKVEKNG